MIAVAVDRSEIWRWTASALVVLALHASGALLLMRWHEPVIGAEPSDAITIDLAPFATPKSESVQDLAPGPELQEAMPEPQPEQPPQEQAPEKTELPPTPEPEVTLPTPEEAVKSPPKLVPQPTVPTAPPRQRTAAPAEVQSWYRRILVQLEQHKGYPAAARARGQTGVVEIAFTIDRAGRVVTSRILRSSGVSALDQEALATVKRAQPFPVPPVDLSGATFDFTVPVRFNIR